MTVKITSLWLSLGAVLCSLSCPVQQASAAGALSVSNASPAAVNEPAKGVERPIFVTVPALFKNLKRPPVMFWHDKHVKAVKEEGCAACHAKKDGKFDFAFPKERDERSPKALRDSYHNACVGCHTRVSGQHRKSGPVNCGECHSKKKAYRPEQYVPVSPDVYNALRDPFHRECIACHRTSEKSAKDAGPLEWKKFHVREKTRVETAWPKVVYDYYLHDKHQKTLEKKCELCHYLSPDRKRTLAAAGKEPAGQDWLSEQEPGTSWKKKESAHFRCLNCHLERAAGMKSHGPVNCKDCHTDSQRPAAELAGVQPPDYGGKERILIQADKAAMAAVPFDHKLHIASSRSCGDCHHDTLAPCKTCHTLKGAKEGKFVTLADAYHKSGSTWSCVGCHEREQKKPDCAGCHHMRKGGLAKTSCAACHTGKLESLDREARLPAPAALFPKDLNDEFEIAVLAKEYDPAEVRHAEIANTLTEISNNSRLAAFFHKEETTICAGCHHMGAVEKGKRVPACGACHTVRNEPSGNTPTLLGAYHQSCLGCHKAMGYPEDEMPQKCDGCHKEKQKREAVSR